jgi:chromodomain-helicase-DNA-binding protein 4
MSFKRQIPDSDASEDSEGEHIHTPEPEEKKEPSPPQSTLSHRFRESPQKPPEDRRREKNSDDSIAVMVPAPARPWEYQPYRGDTTVDAVVELRVMDDREWYTIDYEDGKRELVSVLLYYFLAEMLSVCPLLYEAIFSVSFLEVPKW